MPSCTPCTTRYYKAMQNLKQRRSELDKAGDLEVCANTFTNTEQKPTKGVGTGIASTLQAHFSLLFSLCITERSEDPNLKVQFTSISVKNKISKSISQCFGAE